MGMPDHANAQLPPTRVRLSNGPVTRFGVRLPAGTTHLSGGAAAIAA
jgi:hypothetical protein